MDQDLLMRIINWSNVFYWSRKVLPTIGMVLFFILYVDSCQSRKSEYKRYEYNQTVKDDQIKSFKLKNGQLTKQANAYLVTKKELENQLFVKDDTIKDLLKKLKNPKVVIKIKTETKFDTIFFPFKERISQPLFRKFEKKNSFYHFSGTVDESGVTLHPPKFFNTQHLAVDFYKGKPRITITNSNKFLETNEIEGQVIDIKRKKWTLGAGGVLVPVKPYIYPGIFLGYKLIEF